MYYIVSYTVDRIDLALVERVVAEIEAILFFQEHNQVERID